MISIEHRPAVAYQASEATTNIPPSSQPSLRFDPLRFAKRVVSAEELHGMIAEAAYLRAESRQFKAGNETEDWLAAERDVMQKVIVSGRNKP